MISISEDTKKTLKNAYPEFEAACHAFFRQELPASKYKGISGKFGSYAERGGKTGMVRMRFSGGLITKKQIQFLAEALEKYHVSLVHFTTGQAIQYHKLNGNDILSLYQECFDQDIYCAGGGGDNPRNVTASPLRGVDPKEYFDISPYVDAAASYAITLIPQLHLPRKYKIGFSNGTDNEGHATFKDLGFLAKKNGTFDVYAAGGLGASNPRLGIKVAENVYPTKILYYIDAFAQIFMKYGDYTNRAKARSRFMPTNLGDDEFRRIFQTYLTQAEEKDLDITPVATPITKTAPAAATPTNPRIHPQKQENLYYVSYHPIAGTPDCDVFLRLLQYLATIDGAEIRMNSDETLYAINLTAEEATKAATITETDTAKNTFESSVCCIGAAICQQGLRNSHAMLLHTITVLHENQVNTSLLPQLHISGCPASCGTPQIGAIGLRGAAKKIGDAMQPAFAILAGGSYVATKEKLGTQIGVIMEDNIPAFLTKLADTLQKAGQPFTTWYPEHQNEFAALVNAIE